MSFVKEIGEDSASGALRRVYDAAVARAGGVATIIHAMSLDAKVLNGSMAFYVALMKSKNALTPAQRELVACVVSNANNCYYGTLIHGEDYATAIENKKLAESVIYDYRKAAIEEPDRALCDFAVKLTLDPSSMDEDDVAALRAHGFNDEQIVIACQVVGYVNYSNRIAIALGVDDEIWMMIDPEEWLKKKGKDYLAAGSKKAKAGTKVPRGAKGAQAAARASAAKADAADPDDADADDADDDVDGVDADVDAHVDADVDADDDGGAPSKSAVRKTGKKKGTKKKS